MDKVRKKVNGIVSSKVKSIEKFTLNAPGALDFNIEKHNKEIENIINELTDQYNKFNKDKNSINALKVAKVYNLGLRALDNVLQEKMSILTSVLQNKGLIAPIATIKSLIVLYKNNGYKKESMLLELRLNATIKAVKDHFQEYYRSGVENNYTLLNNLLDLYGREVSEYMIEKEQLEELEEMPNVEIEKIKKDKLFSYRELDLFMKENNFKVIRYTGDHCIYSNGAVSIPVPTRTIGKGLSFEIQKQVQKAIAI